MRIEDDVKLDFKDVLIKPKRSTLRSRKDVDLGRSFTFKHSGHNWRGVPIIASNMDTVGTFEMAKALAKNHMFTCVHKYYSLDEWKEQMPYLDFGFVAPSIGANDEDLEKFEQLLKIAQDIKLSPEPIYFICIDVANGYGEYFPGFVKKMSQEYPGLTIIAGNVVTAEMTEQLILSGADIVKVGLGSGSVCTTRLQTGVGYPQLSAIIECADAAHGLGGQIISDGGCVCPGDVAKAFGAGADFVMLGGMLAGHAESGGKLENGMRSFYGMSSKTANKKYSGGLKNYRAAEGKEVLVEDKGDVDETIQQILGGIRSTCTYIGAEGLKQLSKCTTFVRVSQQVNGVYSEGQ